MTTTTTRTATFTRSGGAWFLRIHKNDWAEGETVTVTLKNGTTKEVTCGDWFEEDTDHYLAAFTDPTSKPKTERKPRTTSTRTATGSDRNKPTGKQILLARRLIRDSQHGNMIVLSTGNFPVPNLDTMTRAEVSNLIDNLTDNAL